MSTAPNTTATLNTDDIAAVRIPRGATEEIVCMGCLVGAMDLVLVARDGDRLTLRDEYDDDETRPPTEAYAIEPRDGTLCDHCHVWDQLTVWAAGEWREVGSNARLVGYVDDDPVIATEPGHAVIAARLAPSCPGETVPVTDARCGTRVVGTVSPDGTWAEGALRFRDGSDDHG